MRFEELSYQAFGNAMLFKERIMIELNRDAVLDISKKLGIGDEESILHLFYEFEDFYEEVRTQHLASVMRTLELYIRRAIRNPDFKIIWKEADLNIGVGFFWNDLNKCAIAVPKKMDEKEARIIVAHELGHMFCKIIFTRYKSGTLLNDKELMQKMANAICIFILSERTNFYEKKSKNMRFNDIDDIIRNVLSMERRDIITL